MSGLSKKILLVASGEYISPALIRREWVVHDLVIAVDGGGNYLHESGLIPDYILGDLDSLQEEIAREWRDKCRFLTFPAEKDETDLELGIKYAAELGAKEVTILGAAGSRLDHTLANFGLLIYAADLGLQAKMVFPHVETFLVLDNFELPAEPGEMISLVPLSSEVRGIKTSGLKYILNNESLFSRKARGIHNEAVGPQICITIEDGLLLVFRFFNHPVK